MAIFKPNQTDDDFIIVVVVIILNPTQISTHFNFNYKYASSFFINYSDLEELFRISESSRILYVNV